MRFISGKSNAQKGRTTGSLGGMRSSHFVTLLLQAYFCIGFDGSVLPTEKDFLYQRNTAVADVSQKRRRITEEVYVGNVSKKILSAIELVLSVYFQCRRSVHTNRSLQQLRETVKYMNAQLTLVWELKQALLGQDPDVCNARKPHFAVHFDEQISLFGCADHFDTSVCESAHKVHTTAVWNQTSKR
jgi:hypothetical protein